ncbi:MAG: prolyl oligopeptidase family serine peptidase [Bacteroidales bacterium]|nr:prolyl oligopeptidase family serine peptidase [Bacteroidales bacterium]
MSKHTNLLMLFLSISFFAFSQTTKKTLDYSDILKWNRITETLISNDGQTIVYKTEPWKGDPTLKITNAHANELLSVSGASKAEFSNDSKHIVFTINTLEDSLKVLKLKKTKKEDFPPPELGIYSVQNKVFEKIAKLKSYKLSKQDKAYLAFQVEAEKDTSKKAKQAKKTDKQALKLDLKNLETNEIQSFPTVSDYNFSEKGSALVFVSEGDGKDFKAGIYYFHLETNKLQPLFVGKADIKQLSINENGEKIAFLADTNSRKKADKNYQLYTWKLNQEEAIKVVDNKNVAIPLNWELSPNGNLSFAPKTNRLFFGIAPKEAKKDTTILEEDIPVLDVWHWNEDVLHTEQLNQLSRDKRKTYLSVYNFDQKQMIQLETKDFSGISLIKKGDDNQAIAWSNKAYAVQAMYEGSPEHNDFYLIDLNTGKSTQIIADCRATPQVSPEGKYIYWYNAMDTTWNTYHLSSNKKYSVTNAKTIQCADELNDIPNPASSYRTAGWLENDEAILIYDRYDIWKVDPENKKAAVNLTINGRSNAINYRLIRFDLDANNPRARFSQANEKGINPSQMAFLFGHNEISRQEGYYNGSLNNGQTPEVLFVGNYSVNTPLKAKDSDNYLFTKENFETYPNLLLSDLSFKKPKQISNANPQQKEFNWGTAELVSWTSLDGKKLEGTLHKPADFDPNKKYPMIVNFYEKNSQELFNYRMPEPHRSTIDYHYYTSNGYLVFNPDIYYKTGYPGEDAFNCIMPGVTALIEKGFVDEKHIGAQGHSWGGYQVAYLATRTNLFAAIESGAPVVNMFSAYGGIRWGSGMSRSFQYEHTQSRIGKSIWESPLRYLENSPLFTLDKVNTPILIMHNDDDGAVPWYQGIEYFIALRRLGKPSWLLNYNEADHWPLKIRDKQDFQIRLAQFFDHYLKGKPMPKWMSEGIPALEKGNNLGYELVE